MQPVKIFQLILLVILCLFIRGTGHAQLQQVHNGSYYVQHFGEEEGLPQNSINSILYDSNDFLWVATESGVSRFNGNRFIPVHVKSNIKNLGLARIQSLYHKGGDTIIAYSAESSLVAFIVDNSIVAVEKRQRRDGMFFINSPEVIAPSFYTSDKSIFTDAMFEQWHWYIENGRHHGRVYHKDTLLVMLQDGIGIYDSSGQVGKIGINNIRPKNSLFLNQQVICADAENYLNFYTPSGLQKRELLPIPTGHKLRLYNNDFKNSFFCVADSILYRIDITASGELNTRQILTNLQDAGDISTIYQKDSNTIVAGTFSSGLYVYRKVFFSLSDPLPNGTPDIFYSQQLLGDSHTILTGTNKLFSNNFYIGETRETYITDTYTSLKDSRGYYWYINKNSLLRAKEIGVAPDTMMHFEGNSKIFFEDAQGRVWFSARELIGYFTSKNFTEVKISNLRPAVITCMEQAANGSYFIGTREGLFILNNINENLVQEVPGLNSYNIRYILPEANGQTWVCTYGHGFFLITKDGMTAFPESNGKLSYVHCIIEDANGYFWMPTNNGLYVTSRESLMAYVSNRSKLPFYYGFTKNNGLRTNEFNGGCQPAYLRLPDGNISLASMHGLVRFNPAAISISFSSSPIMIDNIYTDSIEQTQRDKLEIKSNVHNISFSVSSSFWGETQNDKLEYEVLESGKTPTDGLWLQVDGSGKINLFSPSFGNYQLIIRKRKGLQANDYVYKVTNFTVLPNWYQTQAFASSCVLFFLLVLGGIFFWRRSYYRNANRKLEAKVDTATAELQQMNNTLEKRVVDRTLAIQEAEKKFRTLVEGSLVGVYIVQDENFIYVNPRFEEILGYDTGELEDTYAPMIISKSERDIALEKARKRISGEVSSDHYEITGIKKDGTPRQLEFFGSRTIYKNKPTIIGTMLDITERKQLEIELINAEKKFRHLIEKSLVGVYIIRDGKFVYVNPRFAEIFGYTQQELTDADSVNILVYGPDREMALNEIRQRVENEKEGIHYEVRCIKKDGSIIYTELFVRTTKFEGIPAILGTLLDITARKIAEEQLIKEKDLSQSIINNLPGIFYVFNKDRKHLLWNKRFETVTGYSGTELSEKPAGSLTDETGKEVLGRAIEKAYAEGYAETEAALVCKDGKKLFYYYNGIIVNYNNEPCILGVGINISERKKAENERERANYLLNERIKELTTLYRAGLVLEREDRSVMITLHDFASVIPGGWQYHAITAARVKLGELEFCTPNFKPVPFSQTAGFTTSTGVTGSIEVVYLQEMPQHDEGPFMAEERHLIDMLADMLKIYLIRKEATDALQKSEANLNTIFDNTDTVYALLDANAQLIAFNHRAVDFAEKELKKTFRLYTDFIPYFPEHRWEDFRKNIAAVMNGNTISYEKNYPQPDGTVNWYYVRMFPIVDPGKIIFGLMVAVSDITEKKLLEQEILNQKVQEQKMVTRAVLLGEERERNKIGQELHDNINQILAGTKIFLGLARKRKTTDENIIDESIQLLDKAIEEIRFLSRGKVTPMKRVNLQELLQTLIDRFHETTRIQTSFIYNGSGQVIEDDLKLNIYRVVQEQLNNILKHAGAKNISIRVVADSKSIHVRISDDGKGFDVNSKRTGIGLANMINRIESFNGVIDIQSNPGNGCKINIVVPLI